MQQHKYGRTSLTNLMEVHPRMVAFAFDLLFLSPWDLGVSDGKRTMEEQKEEVAMGNSQTLDSYHLLRIWEDLKVPAAGAIDIHIYSSRGKSIWEFPAYQELYKGPMQEAAEMNDLKIKWGGLWKSKDGPHIQMDYPSEVYKG